MSTPDPDPAQDPYLVVLFDLNSEFRVHSSSDSSPMYVPPELIVVVGDQIQLQIHIWAVLFDLNFHCIDII